MAGSDGLNGLLVVLFQWWLWITFLVAAGTLVVAIWGRRRYEVHDFVLRVVIVLQVLLLFGSILAAVGSGAFGARLHPEKVEAWVTQQGAHRLEIAGLEDAGATPPPAADRRVRNDARTAGSARRGVPSIVQLGVPGHAWLWTLVLAVYAIGVVAGIVRLLRDAYRAARLGALGRPSRSPHLRAAAAAAYQRLGVARQETVLTSAGYAEVLLLGWRRPAILVPEGFADRLTRRELEAILMHELAHHKRGDIFWSLAARLLLIFTWLVPVNRWVVRQLRVTAEILCDRLAASAAGSAAEYVRGLVAALASSREGPNLSCVASSLGSKSFVKRRVEMLLAEEPRPENVTRRRRVVMALLCVSFAAPLVTVQIRAAQKPPPPDPHGGAYSVAKDPLPEEIQEAQAALAARYLEQAAAAYQEEAFGKVRRYVQEAHRLGGLGNTVYALTDTMGVLALANPGEGTGEPKTAPFISQCVAKHIGSLEDKGPGYWLDLEAGILVHETAFLEALSREFRPWEDRDRLVVIRLRFLRADSPLARLYAALFGETADGTAFKHARSDEASQRLRALLEEIDSAFTTISAPAVSCRAGQTSCVNITTQHAYIEKYRLVTKGSATVADPVAATVDTGLTAHLLPVLTDKGAVRLFLRATMKELVSNSTVYIDLPPYAKQVPIAIPNVEEHTIFGEFLIRGDNGVLVRTAPALDAPEDQRKLENTYLWIHAEVVKPADADGAD